MKKLLFFFSFIFLIFFSINTVSAQSGVTNNVDGNNGTIVNPCVNGVCTLPNPLAASGVSTPQELIGKVINSVLGVVGSLALLMFIYGGLTWMTSAGSSEKVKKGRDIIIWSAIGLFIIFASYALIRFLISSL